MRVCSIVFGVMIATATTAVAQDRTVAVGVKGGVNFATLRFEADGAGMTLDRRTGLVGGVFLVWPATARVALQPEVLFSQKGAKIDQMGATGTAKLDYLDVPVLLRLSSPASGRVSFHGFGGPSLGFRLRARTTGTFDGEVSANEDISEDLKRFDLGLVAGAGIEVGRMTIDARHTWGVSNIFRDDDEEGKVKSRVISLMAGFRF